MKRHDPDVIPANADIVIQERNETDVSDSRALSDSAMSDREAFRRYSVYRPVTGHDP
jgi:hypothetical protein